MKEDTLVTIFKILTDYFIKVDGIRYVSITALRDFFNNSEDSNKEQEDEE